LNQISIQKYISNNIWRQIYKWSLVLKMTIHWGLGIRTKGVSVSVRVSVGCLGYRFVRIKLVCQVNKKRVGVSVSIPRPQCIWIYYLNHFFIWGKTVFLWSDLNWSFTLSRIVRISLLKDLKNNISLIRIVSWSCSDSYHFSLDSIM